MYKMKERMVQLQDVQKGAEFTSDVSERELELEAQLVEARSIIQEQVSYCFINHKLEITIEKLAVSHIYQLIALYIVTLSHVD